MNKQDSITLKRSVEGEFAPQYWTMTGGEFHTMLDAVKALPFRKWQDSERVWLVKFDGIQVLRESGYTITRNPDVHVELRHGSESVEKLENGSNAEIVLNYRTFIANREGWAISPVLLPEFHITLHFDFDPEEINKLADEERADEITQKHIPEKNMDSFCHDSAIYKLTIRALRELDEKVAAAYREHRGKRTKGEHKAAVQKVWEFLLLEGVKQYHIPRPDWASYEGFPYHIWFDVQYEAERLGFSLTKHFDQSIPYPDGEDWDRFTVYATNNVNVRQIFQRPVQGEHGKGFARAIVWMHQVSEGVTK